METLGRWEMDLKKKIRRNYLKWELDEIIDIKTSVMDYTLVLFFIYRVAHNDWPGHLELYRLPYEVFEHFA